MKKSLMTPLPTADRDDDAITQIRNAFEISKNLCNLSYNLYNQASRNFFKSSPKKN
jgi:hypothetical protein